jgi:hypothetical protein
LRKTAEEIMRERVFLQNGEVVCIVDGMEPLAAEAGLVQGGHFAAVNRCATQKLASVLVVSRHPKAV